VDATPTISIPASATAEISSHTQIPVEERVTLAEIIWMRRERCRRGCSAGFKTS
jgi:hypothetical protein